MKVDWNDVKEDYARKNAEIEELKKEVEYLKSEVDRLTSLHGKGVKCKTYGCAAVDGFEHSNSCLAEHESHAAMFIPGGLTNDPRGKHYTVVCKATNMVYSRFWLEDHALIIAEKLNTGDLKPCKYPRAINCDVDSLGL